MLNKVEVLNSVGDLLSLPFDNSANGLVVEEIEGLGPVTATMSSSKRALIDGAVYQASRRETRNIRIRLGLEPNYSEMTVEELRQSLYAFFMPKSEITLTFYSSLGPDPEIVGRVESCE